MGMEGNEVADSYAKKSRYDTVDRELHAKGKLRSPHTKAYRGLNQCAREWIRSHVKSSRRHRTLRGGRIR